MAITIQQQPTSPNIANSNLVYLATSTQVNQPQFQFVVDIKDDNNTLIQRIKQQPNPSSKGVFDLGNLIPTTLGPTDRVWDTSIVSPNTSSGADYKVYFGEEYGTSPSSSTLLYNGLGTGTGDPAQSGSDYYFLLDGVTNPNELVNWNWDSGSKYDREDASDDSIFTYQNGLTPFDTQSIRTEDYHTISFLNGNLDSEPKPDFAQNVFAVTCRQYDSAGVEISSSIIYNETIYGPDPTTKIWFQVYTSQSEDTRLVHFPAGPQNFSDAGLPISSSCAYYTLTFNQQGTDGFSFDSGIWGQYRFNIDNTNCYYPGVRFAYKNQYGVWDYFNFTLAESTTSNISREEYKQTFVNFSNTDNSVDYNTERRGRNNYYNNIDKVRTADSDWLTQSDADNLRELFFSTDVYVQTEAGYLPVVFTQTSITEKTNPRTQKLFRYTAEYRYANGIRPRL